MGTIEIALRVTARSPLSVGAGGSAGTLANKSILRDGRGRPIIPASQVKGKARHAAEALLLGLGRAAQVPEHFDDDQHETWIQQIFGSPQRRSPLCFADLAATTAPAEPLLPAPRQPEHDKLAVEWRAVSPIRPSVSLSRSLGTAEHARLLFQEISPEALVFESSEAVVGRLPALGHAALLWAALRLVHSWGGAKTRGLGWAEVRVAVQWTEQGQAPRLLDDNELQDALRALLAKESGL